jgi:hypothetical protein
VVVGEELDRLSDAVVPFLVFALSGGAAPLPLTVLQIRAIDLRTETLPALALGREPAEPGLTRARLGVAGYRIRGAGDGWVLLHPGTGRLGSGDPTGTGTGLHHAYL